MFNMAKIEKTAKSERKIVPKQKVTTIPEQNNEKSQKFTEKY